MPIICIGWGSLVWDPRELPIRGGWHFDGPLVRIEFLRESRDRRITLVLDEQSPACRSCWALMDSLDLESAKFELARREGTKASHIGSWKTDDPEPLGISGLPAMAKALNLGGAIWTSLGPKFGGEDGIRPTVDQVLSHLNSLDGEPRRNAERYVRNAPKQIDTPYRRKIESHLGWTTKTLF